MRITRGCLVGTFVGATFSLPFRDIEAQRRRALDMYGDYIVAITERWGDDRRLGQLSTKEIGFQDVELRFWGGFGLVGTRGLILSRTNGQWSASRVTVRNCQIALPIPVADTLSEVSQQRYEVEARRRCGEPPVNPLNAYATISSDTLDVAALRVPDLERVWSDLVGAGVTTLPTSVWRSGMMLDGHTYVVQLRLGPDYRVSRIEHWSSAETTADKAVQHINALLSERIGWGY